MARTCSAIGRGDRRREQAGQVRRAPRLVALVDGAVADAAPLGQLEQVADVVEQRGGHQRVARAGGPGQRRGLQRVLELGDLLVVALRAPPLEQREHLVDRRRGPSSDRPALEVADERHRHAIARRRARRARPRFCS